MTTQQVATGVVHELPDDLRVALVADAEVLVLWTDITASVASGAPVRSCWRARGGRAAGRAARTVG